MKIIESKLLEPYFFADDGTQYAVKKKMVSEKGKEYESILGYYTSLSGAVGRIARDKMADAGRIQLEDYIKEYKEWA